ncbi:PaaI family thioesterase [Emcibacter nanhaiensis]|uniref:PaaI family thioesterase n=1 Tax=Emcibacter nanhaiensis TaxID=1505037 RepID=A0A501PNA8_9PROT|nr:PaaI family thioesterase [Emcibacter nanhaiensis]TPD61775.1 PaaI family thioesterase [Emcibacter nanhaiensis]
MSLDLKQILPYVMHANKIGIEILGTEGTAVLSRLNYSDAISVGKGKGIIANGAVSTLLDTALGMAVFQKVGELRGMATLDLRVDFLRASTPFSPINARSECIRLTREVAFVQGEAWCEDPAQPVARASAAFSISDQNVGSMG